MIGFYEAGKSLPLALSLKIDWYGGLWEQHRA
jgi:hypothetical protein